MERTENESSGRTDGELDSCRTRDCTDLLVMLEEHTMFPVKVDRETVKTGYKK